MIRLKIRKLSYICGMALLLFAFANCSRLNVSVPNVKMSSKSFESEIGLGCSIQQISSAVISEETDLEFSLNSSGALQAFEYSCNNTSWQYLEMVRDSSGKSLIRIPNIPIGSYVCNLRGVADATTYPCRGHLSIQVIARAENGNPPMTPPVTPAVGQFQSLHQAPVTYIVSSSLDSTGALVFTKTAPLYGFKNQYSPQGTPGCVLGYPEFRSQCETAGEGSGFDIPGPTYQTAFKIYIPKGTKLFGASGYFPQSVKYAVSVRLDAPPSRTAALSDAEYDTALRSQNRNTDFEKLLKGEERLMVHDSGGSMSFSGIARLSTNPLASGHWLYIRVLNGSDPVHGLGAIYEFDRNIYRQAFEAMSFGSNGDPL